MMQRYQAIIVMPDAHTAFSYSDAQYCAILFPDTALSQPNTDSRDDRVCIFELGAQDVVW